MPDYQTGYYKSATCEPNESDVRVLSHYLRHDQYPRTVREGIVQYKKVELAVNQNLDPTTFIKSELPPPPPEEEAPNEEGETNKDTMGAQTKRAPASRISTGITERSPLSACFKWVYLTLCIIISMFIFHLYFIYL